MIARLACLRAGALIDRRSAGLAEHDRIALETHLAECAACAEDARAVRGIVDALRAGPGTALGAGARGRVLARALAGVPSAAAPARGRVPWWAATAAVASAAAVVLLVATGGEQAPQARAPAGPSPDVHVLGHARARFSGGAVHRWSARDLVLRLDRGRAYVEVDPRAGRPFVVATERIHVRVLGTRFYVDAGAGVVRVDRGAVRVEAPDGRVLVERLAAGGRFRAPAPDRERTAAHPARADVPAFAPEPVRASSREPRAPTLPRRTAAEWVALAREHLAARDPSAAREAVHHALGARPPGQVRSDALLVLAECEVVEGDTAAAVRAYDRVAREHAELAAGEIASFAAARLEANAGRTHSARTRLESHLARWPRGRFTREARARLDALAGGD